MPVETENKDSLQKEAQKLLNQCFGFTEFRKGQWGVIENILNKINTIAVFPTGGGKSLCYQLPALMMPGTTIVISPLISLMKDQVDSLVEKGIAATFISSTVSDSDNARRIMEIARGKYKIVYIAPERFQSDTFTSVLKNIHIPFIAVDEAHCVSQWGHNFRPSYLKIRDLIQLAGNPVVAAFTATANDKVQKDMIKLLGFSECRLFVGSFDRPNLEFRIEEPKSAESFVLNYAQSHPDKPGIVYASTRKNVESLYFYLKNKGVRAGMYHAGLTAEQRNFHQDRFISGEIQVMVATNAFGMGIDKSDVRFIIHYNMPVSMENYYQEAGRAGRDGKKSVCILLKNHEDYSLNKFLINGNYPPVKIVRNMFDTLKRRKNTGIPVEVLVNRKVSGSVSRESALKKNVEYGYAEIRGGIAYPTDKEHFELTQKEIDFHKKIELDKLEAMQRYFEVKTCLRAYILRYFNEEPAEERCGNCSLCYRSTERDRSNKINSILARIFGD